MDMHSKWRQRLLPAVLILFLLQVLFFPFAVGTTYSDRSQSPDHILTYSDGDLIWDNATGINDEGAAELHLFDAVYDNVASSNGDNVIAPGTEGHHFIRLKNDENYDISYMAVMYEIKENENLPVKTTFSVENAEDAENYVLPDDVEAHQVMKAVTGTVKGKEIQDFDIHWLWEYYVSDAQDMADTALGNKAAFDVADDITVGIYIVVEGDNGGGGGTPPGTDNPKDPEDPENPENPENPEDPTDPVEPIDPVDPTDPDIPTEPENPADSSDSDTSDSSFEHNEISTDSEESTYNDYIYPQVPKTGDSSNINMYVGLMVISGIVLLLLLVEVWRERRCKKY